MRNNKLKTSRALAVLAVGISLTVFSCGTSQDDSSLNIIGGDYVKKENPLVNSVVMLSIKIGNKPTTGDFLRSIFTGDEVPKTSEGLCTGTVVENPNDSSKWHIVTAAHCLQGDVSSVEIYKGSKAFAERAVTVAQNEVMPSGEGYVSRNKAKKKSSKATMQDNGFQLVAQTSLYANHKNFNSEKMTLKNKISTLNAQQSKLEAIMQEFSWRAQIESGLLKDLENKNDDFHKSLASELDKQVYVDLANYVAGDTELLTQALELDKSRIQQVKLSLDQVTKALNTANKLAEEKKDLPDDDIALLTIEGKMPSSLNPLGIAETPFEANEKISLLGYGLSYKLLDKKEWASPDQPEAIQTIRDLKIIDLPVTEVNLNTKEAVFEVEQSGGLCVGDSGGPALAKSGNTYILAGINTQANCRNSSRITVISEYQDWLQSHM